MTTTKKIGIIAGNGQFPILLARSAKKVGMYVLAVGFRGETLPGLESEVDEMHWVKLGQLNKLIKIFKKAAIGDVAMAGGITKTKLYSKIRPDWRAIRLLSKLDANRDDAILRAVAAELESEGIRVQPSTIYLDSLLAIPGVMTRRRPSKKEKEDIEYGWKLSKEIGRLDIGQCLVVKEKAVLAVEGIDGTDATILRGGKLCDGGAVVIKTSKPIQDLRFDVPAVGIQTIRSMIEVNASALVLEAGRTIMFDREEMIDLANRHRISILALSPEQQKSAQTSAARANSSGYSPSNQLRSPERISPEKFDRGTMIEAFSDEREQRPKETVIRDKENQVISTTRTDALRVAVIGVGYLGKYHAQKYTMLEDVDLVGVVDIVPDRASAVADQFGTRAFTDYREILEVVDAVSVVVPTTDHFHVAKDCIEAGVHILLEKPMTATLEEAIKLENLAKEQGVIIQVGHLERFNPAVQAMLHVVTSPMFIEAHRLMPYKERGTEVNVVLDLMIHDIDIILHIVQSPLEGIYASGVQVLTTLPDIANVRLRFENGCTANITASRISTKTMRKIRIFQPDSYLSVDYAKPEVMLLERVGPADESGFPEIKLGKMPILEKDALEEEIRSFVRVVKETKPPVVSASDGRKALEIALAISDQIRAQLGRLAMES